MRRLLLAIVLAACAMPVAAQSPDAEWRTIETAHFRFHYPAPFEEWTLSAATRMESIRTTLIEEIGYAAPERVDVIVADPLATANGSAWPFIGWPRLVLYTNPPGPASSIGTNRDWIEMLTLHEQAHLIHILRPSRNPMRRILETLVPFGPIAYSPRWITEGYATLLEGELTGSGRPNSDFRAAVIRQWARQGRMPTYAQLNSDRASWMGMSMAYLVGSSYLEWLRERAGEESLRNLWRRVTARSGRSFDDAFSGVFGDSPRTLYARYVAEVTQKALEAEENVRATAREGELWQDLSWTTGAPDMSDDGRHLVTVLRGREKPSRIVVWSTAPDEEAEKKHAERIAKMLERDPEDVAPVRTKPLPRKPRWELRASRETEPHSPRWLPDGKRILFGRFEMDGDGVLHPDLFIWSVESDDVRRVTELADVRDADPSPDGSAAVAVRNRNGKSQLVVVDLANGQIRDLTPASVQTVYASPRWGANGFAYSRQSKGAWELIVRDLDSGAEQEIFRQSDSHPLSPPEMYAHPAWSADGTKLYASIAHEGFIEIHEMDPTGWDVRPLTLSAGASFAPAPSPDGKALFYLSLDADGFDIRRLSLTEKGQPPWPRSQSPALAPVVWRKPQREPVAFASERGQLSRPYGIGRQEFSWILAGNESPSNRNAEFGIRFGDVVGRLDTLLLGAAGGREGEEGFALASSWRGWPVALSLHLFDASQDLSAQPQMPVGGTLALDGERRGAELRTNWEYRQLLWNLAISSGFVSQEVDGPGIEATDQQLGYLTVSHTGARAFGRLRLSESLRLRGTAGETAGESWRRGALLMSGDVTLGRNGLALTFEEGANSGADHPLDRLSLGGIRSSIVPDAAVAHRVHSAALPIGTATGDAFQRQRADLRTSVLPFALFYERFRLWDNEMARGAWIATAGAELRYTTRPQPLLRVPGLDFRLGAGRILDEPLKDENVWWLTATWRP
ncbi:MAG: hypothetical protein ACYC7A_18880 [Thermoanaerobaculia bacterium]